MSSPPAVVTPPGFALRQYRPADRQAYLTLMHRAGFLRWDERTLEGVLSLVLPGGFFVIEHTASGQVVAAAMATHRPSPLYPFGGELSWVAADPDYSGNGLGLAVSAAVVRRFLEAGYRCIYLQTDDFRLPAIKTYLRLGFEPVAGDPEMVERWQRVLDLLKWRA